MRFSESAAPRVSFDDPRFARFEYAGKRPLKLAYTMRGVEKKALLQPGEVFAVRNSGLRGALLLIQSLGSTVIFKPGPDLLEHLKKYRRGAA